MVSDHRLFTLLQFNKAYNLPYGAKFLRGKILTNKHVESFYENFLTNSIMLTPTFINGWRDLRGKTVSALIMITPSDKMWSGYASVGCKCRLV